MAAPPSAYKDRQFLSVIGDEACTSFSLLRLELSLTLVSGLCDGLAARWYWCTVLLASNPAYMDANIHLQHVTAPPDNQKNFLVVDAKTDNATIEAAFDRFTTERKDIGILLINQHACHSLIYLI